MCKTIYAITEDEKAERIHLTKTRDLNHCQEKIMKDVGVAYTEKCVQCQEVDSKLLCSLHIFCIYKLWRLLVDQLCGLLKTVFKEPERGYSIQLHLEAKR